MISIENHKKILICLAIACMAGLIITDPTAADQPTDSWNETFKSGMHLIMAFISYPLLWAFCLYGMGRGFAPILKGQSSGDNSTLVFLSFTSFIGLNIALPYVYA